MQILKENFLSKIFLFVFINLMGSIILSVSALVENNKLIALLCLLTSIPFSLITSGYIIESFHNKINLGTESLPIWNGRIFYYLRKGVIFTTITVITVFLILLLALPVIFMGPGFSYIIIWWITVLLLASWCSYAREFKFYDAFSLSKVFRIISKNYSKLLFFSALLVPMSLLCKYIFPLSHAFPSLLNIGKFNFSVINNFGQTLLTQTFILMIGNLAAETVGRNKESIRESENYQFIDN